MEFLTTQREIIRRKKAFVAMCAFFLIGLFLASLFFDNKIPFFIFNILILILLLFGILTLIFLSSAAQNKLFIDDKIIRLSNSKNSTEITLHEINKIKIKRKISGIIREMYLWTKGGESLFFNAFENDFAKIEKIILKSVNKNIKIVEFKEPIDLDHFLFYPIFGSCVGIFTGVLLNSMLNASALIPSVGLWLFCVYAFILGIFFIIKKPILSRDTRSKAMADYAIGIILIIVSIIIFIRARNG